MAWVWWTILNIVSYGFAVALYKIETQRLSKPYVAVIFVATLSAVVVYIPYFIFRFQQDPVLFTDIRWVGLFIVGLIVAALAYGLNVQAIKLSELSVIGPLDNLRPFFVMLLSVILLKQLPTVTLFFGSCLIVLGAYLLQQQKRFGTALRQLMSAPGSRYMIFSALLFALLGIIDKLSLKFIQPEYAVLTGLGGLSVLYGIRLIVTTKSLKVLPYFSWRLIVCGLLMILSSLSILKALQLSSPNYVVPLQVTRTFFISFLGFILFKEKGVIRKLLAGMVMFVGVLLVLRSG